MILIFLFPSFLAAQAISPYRTWTHSSGKTIQAELLKFSDEYDRKGVVRLRMKGGTTHSITPLHLSAVDRTTILKSFLQHRFNTEYDRSSNSYSTRSKRIKGKYASYKSTGYIGFNADKSWLKLRVAIPRSTPKEKAYLLINHANDLLRIDLEDSNLTSRYLEVDASEHIAMLNKLWLKPEQTKVYIEDSNGKYTSVPISSTEKDSFKETTKAYTLLTSTDHLLWWATYKGLDPASLKKEKPKEEDVAIDLPPLTEPKNWTLANGETLHAALKAFSAHKIVFEIPNGDSDPIRKHYLIDELDRDTREQIAKLRMNHSLQTKWHPYDDNFAWYWPKENKSINLLLFTIETKTGVPHLYFQTRYGNTTGEKLKSCRISSPNISLDMQLILNPQDTLHLRSGTSTKHWHKLSDQEANLLLIAAAGIEKIEFEVVPETGEPIQKFLSDDEFKSSIEAIEVYRAWHSLTEKNPTEN